MAIWASLSDAIKKDYVRASAALIPLGNFGVISFLFDPFTATTLVYTVSGFSAAALLAVSIRYLRKSAHSDIDELLAQRRSNQMVAAVYLLLSIAVTAPAVYRFLLRNSEVFDSDATGGGFNFRLVGNAYAQSVPADVDAGAPPQANGNRFESNTAVYADAQFDSSRSSYRCVATRESEADPQERLDIRYCRAFDIPRDCPAIDGRSVTRSDFDNSGHKIQAVLAAIVATQNHRRRMALSAPMYLIDRGVDDLFGLVSNEKGRRKLLGLLPNREEWGVLWSTHPSEAQELLSFVSRWVGLLDPVLTVSFVNSGNRAINIARVKYTLKYLDSDKAYTVGAASPMDYLLDLEEGVHELTLRGPPIALNANSTKTVSFVLRKAKPNPGSAYELKLAFTTNDELYAAPVDPFNVRFWLRN